MTRSARDQFGIVVRKAEALHHLELLFEPSEVAVGDTPLRALDSELDAVLWVNVGIHVSVGSFADHRQLRPLRPINQTDGVSVSIKDPFELDDPDLLEVVWNGAAPAG